MVLAEVVPLRVGVARVDEWVEAYARVLGLQQSEYLASHAQRQCQRDVGEVVGGCPREVRERREEVVKVLENHAGGVYAAALPRLLYAVDGGVLRAISKNTPLAVFRDAYES